MISDRSDLPPMLSVVSTAHTGGVGQKAATFENNFRFQSEFAIQSGGDVLSGVEYH